MKTAASRRRSRGTGASAYLRARRTTLLFCGLFLFGLLFASVFCVGKSEAAQTVRSIIGSAFSIGAQNTVWQRIQKALVRNAFVFLFLYFCAHCSKGILPASAVPLLTGMVCGSRATGMLMAYGAGALRYNLLAIALPKLPELLLLAGMYNTVCKSCKTNTAPEQEGGIRKHLLVLAGLAFQAALEGWCTGLV